MTDIGLSVLVTRDLLSLPSLELNDHVKFIVGTNLLGGQVAWDRQTVTSPWVHGEVTVNRRLQMVREQLSLWVIGETYAEMMTNVAEVVAAFNQGQYSLQVTVGAVSHSWFCESADYQVQFSNVGVAAHKLGVTFQIPRQPVAAAGGF